MDGNSGRYSAQPVAPGSKTLIPNRSPDNVKAAAELAKQTGSQQTIVPSDKVFP